MKLAVVGVGNAGSRIVNHLRARERTTGRNLCDGNVLLINSTEPAFARTEHVPQERRLTIGDAHWKVDDVSIDGDPDLGAEVAQEERNEIVRGFDLIDFHRVDGVLVVAGLAGGTGGGAGAVVIDRLQAICDEPVYAVGVLPRESEGRRRAMTAARALQSFVGKADNVIAFDNDAWLDDTSPDVKATDSTDEGDSAVERDEESSVEGDGVDEGYERANAALAERLITLFGAGEFDGASASETRLDPSDVIRVLDTGGVSSIGYASTDLPRTGGVRSWIRRLWDRLDRGDDRGADDDEDLTAAAKVDRLVRRAARSKLTLPCEVTSAERALIALSGPSRALSRKGFENGRYWLEREADIVDVMAGDDPHDRSTTLTAVVLFSNVTEVPRIDAMQEQAVDEQQPARAEGMRFGTTNSQ